MMKFSVSLFALLVILAVPPTTHAQNLYWDVDTIDSLGAGGGGSPAGTWNVGTTPNWNANSDGSGLPGVWTDGNTAVFAAGGDATGPYTVSVVGSPSATGITFEEGPQTTITGGQITLTGTTPTIALNGSAEHHIGSVIAGTSGITVTGDATLFLGGASTYSGATVVSPGAVLKLEAAATIPDTSVLSLANGNVNTAFHLNGFDETVASISNGGTTGTASKLFLGTNTLTLADPQGETSGTLFQSIGTAGNFTVPHGKIIKNGSGTITLNGATGAFTGGEFVVNNGSVNIGANNAFGTSVNGSKLVMNGGSLTTAVNMSMNTQFLDIGGNFGVNMNTTGNLQFLGNGGNGPITLTANNPTITVNPDSTTTRLVIPNPNAPTAINGIFILAGPISNDSPGTPRGFTKSGDAMMTVSNPSNTYTGETTIQQGILRLSKAIGANATNPATNHDGRLGDGTGRANLSGGTLAYNGSQNDAGHGGAATDPRILTVPNPIRVTADSAMSYISTTANLQTVHDINFVFTSNDISGTGGTLTLKNDGVCTSNSNSCVFRPTFSGSGFNFSQPVAINNQINDATTGRLSTRSTVLQSSNSSGTQTWSGPISGTGIFRRSAAGGATVLSGANIYTGGTLVDGGTLTVSGASATFGSGDVTVNAGSAAISAAVANAILDTAKLTLAGGGTAGLADTGFTLLAAGINERVGTLVLGANTFTSGTYGAPGSGAANTVGMDEYFSGTGIITVGAAGLPGDFNSDGKVDAGDYATWRKNDGTSNALANDNGLGVPVGASHFNLWRANFGNPPGAGSGGGLSGGAVPEPGTLLLLICAVGSCWAASSRALRRQGR